MIPANKNDLLDTLLFVYFRWLTRRNFHTVAARGLEHLRTLPADRPVLIFCNHCNWWDGLIAYLLTRQMPGKAVYCMMEEKQLQYYRFFTWLGAFSVDLTSPLRSAASLRYTHRLLQRPETAVWLFPQGRLCLPAEPVEVRPALEFLARNAPHALLVPVAMRYEFFRESRPNVLVEIGAPSHVVDRPEGWIADACNEVRVSVSRAVEAQRMDGFEPLFKPRWTINKRWEWVKLALRGRLRDFSPTN